MIRREVRKTMEHLIEVAKIIEGGMRGDKKMVKAFTELLCEKLKKEGNQSEAELLIKRLDIKLIDSMPKIRVLDFT